MKRMQINRIFHAFLLVGLMTGCATLDRAVSSKPAISPPPSNAKAVSATESPLDPALGMNLVLVRGGCFQMGDFTNSGEPDEKPRHEVCLTDFYLGKFEVTQIEWERVMGSIPPADTKCGQDCPVGNVSWLMAQEFIAKLNRLSGKSYRLPTEAEWEYAARDGGKNERWSGTNDLAQLGSYAWFNENSETVRHPVGKLKGNALGIHDMSGNMNEWCQDWYGDVYYAQSPKDNPAGPTVGERRVLRGGSLDPPERIRTTKRASDPPDLQDGMYGFRLVLPVK